MYLSPDQGRQRRQQRSYLSNSQSGSPRNDSHGPPPLRAVTPQDSAQSVCYKYLPSLHKQRYKKKVKIQPTTTLFHLQVRVSAISLLIIISIFAFFKLINYGGISSSITKRRTQNEAKFTIINSLNLIYGPYNFACSLSCI